MAKINANGASESTTGGKVKMTTIDEATANLAATLAAFDDTPDDRRVLTATQTVVAGRGEIEWTGLTFGDLRALHNHATR